MCFLLVQDGEGGVEETNFDPGYEPDWAVISTVKQNRAKEQLTVADAGTNAGMPHHVWIEPRNGGTSGYEPVNIWIVSLCVCVTSSGHWGAFSLPLSQLYSLRRARFSLGRNFLVLTSRAGDPLPPLHFHRGGTRELLRAMQRYIRLAP